MVKINYEKWGDDPESLKQRALTSPHVRTRERFMALYEVSQSSSATSIALASDRDPQTIMRWIRKYNICGPRQLEYQRTGGAQPFLKKSPRN